MKKGVDGLFKLLNISYKKKMDLTIDVEDYKLNVRATVIIEHNGKILVHRNVNSNHYALMGGRVKIGEDSETTVKREVVEELGKKIEVIGYVTTTQSPIINNVIAYEDCICATISLSKYHEILFVHKAEFVDEEDKKIEYTLKNIEGEDWLKYEWLDISKIDEYPLLPTSIKSVLKENKFPVHKINKDI